MPVPTRPSRTTPRPPRRRGTGLAVLAGVVALVLVAAACAGGDGSTGSAGSAVAIPDTLPVHVGPRQLLDGFEEVTVTVTTPDGEQRELCLLLAATPEDHQRGLMHVTDLTLGGYDGMLFLFEDDSTGGFWMKNTRLPLSIAYLDDGGAIVSTADMEPCPDDVERCPGYPPAGPYRMAIEVVQGRLDDLGIEGEATVAVGGRSCPPAV